MMSKTTLPTLESCDNLSYDTITIFSDKMGEEPRAELNQLHNFLQHLQDGENLNNGSENATITIKSINQDLAELGFLEQAVFPEIAKEIQPELHKICKEYALPTNPGTDSATQAHVFSTLNFHNIKTVDCYCQELELTGAIFADCQVLRGGNLDKTYYIALAHETLTYTGYRGITVMARFDPRTSREAMNIALLILWDIIRLLAKLEGIDLEHISPIFPLRIRSSHVSMFTLPCTDNHKEILMDVANTVLTIWPRLLEVTAGPMGKYKPVEVHFVFPGKKSNIYWHAGAMITEYDAESINKLIAYQGIHNKHRKPSTKHLKAILDIIQPIIPEINNKAQVMVEIIRNAAAQITNRVNLLAAAGISLVRTRTHSNTNILTKLNTISLYSFIGGYTGRSRRYGPDITIFYPTKLPAVSNNGNTHIIHQSFFQN